MKSDNKNQEEDKPLSFLQEFDFYKDLPKEIAQPTFVGATMSVGVVIALGLLMLYQVVEFLKFQSTSEILVNTAEEDQFFKLNLDITLHETPCSIISLDIVDVTGVHVVNVGGKMEKFSLNKHGEVLRSYDAYADEITNQQKVFDETVRGLQQKEGCKLKGSVDLHKVPGNFHISSHTN